MMGESMMIKDFLILLLIFIERDEKHLSVDNHHHTIPLACQQIHITKSLTEVCSHRDTTLYRIGLKKEGGLCSRLYRCKRQRLTTDTYHQSCAVVYRDHSDEYLTRISRLTDDIAVTQSFIEKQEASGGGDYEEAVPEALMAAINSAGWDENARARILFLVLDAPCHEDSATVTLLHEQVRNAAAQGIRIVPVVCSGLEKSGEYLLRSIALATNGTAFFLTDDSGIGNSHLKPTTDSMKVEHLNDMLVRTIVEFSAMPACEGTNELPDEGMNGEFIPNPFDTQDIATNPEIPHGEGVHYIVDISGKLIGMFEGDIDDLQLSSYQLPIGVYFIKTYIDGKWYTKKVLKY